MSKSGDDSHTIHIPSTKIFWVLWIVVTAWLIACAFLVNGEYGDGYLTIANARYFFSDNPLYWLQRGPLAAIMLWPVEVLVELLNIGPFEVTPYHLYSAAWHSVYLLGCWWALGTTGGSPVARILAFATAITTVAFYGFAPYLSHDILPGLLFLLMIYLANRWLNTGGRRDAVLLIALGAAVVLIKQTYAIVWVAVVLYAGLSALFRWDDGRVSWRKLLLLLGFASISAAVTFVSYAAFIADDWGFMPWYIRPWAVVLSVSDTFSRKADLVFPADLYLRNLHNLGILAMLLVIPGLVMALRGSNARLRMIAVCWLLSAAVIQAVMFKEVRYALFLAPLTAMLIVAPIEWALRHRALLAAMVLVVIVDQVRGFSVAANQLTATATIDPVRFFEAPGIGKRVVASEIVSFVYDPQSPLLRDSYHGIYHISARVIFALQENEIEVYELDDTRKLGEADLQPGDRVYVANFSVRRFAPYTPDNSPNELSSYIAVAGRTEIVTLRRQQQNYVVEDFEGSPVMLVPDAEMGEVAPLLSSSVFEPQQLETIYVEAPQADSVEVTGIVVDAICRGDLCRYR